MYLVKKYLSMLIALCSRKLLLSIISKKRAEGKHYNVAISHAAKKLVRVIYQLEKSKQAYIKQS